MLAGKAVETLKRDQRAETMRATMRHDIDPEASESNVGRDKESN